MRICFALLYHDARLTDTSPAQYLAALRTVRDLPAAVAARGHDVHVVHHHPVDDVIVEGGVTHHFVRPGALSRQMGSMAGSWLKIEPAYAQPAWRAIECVRRLRPDVVHFLGATLHLNLALLIARLGGGPPILLHYQGGQLARRWMSRHLQNYGTRRADGVLFTTTEQADQFRAAGFQDARGRPRIFTFMEASSVLSPVAKDEARRRTGMTGRPVYLSAARLHPIKDPMTMLRGFAAIAAAQPEAQLYLHYLSDELLSELRDFVRTQADLRHRVHFRGAAPFDQMGEVFSSADFLLQASHREFSGCAVLDAMACGVIPIVTDLAPFRVMTGEGQAGVHFRPGDAASMARQALAIPLDSLDARAAEVRAYFDAHLSFGALAWRLEQTYRALVESASDRYSSTRRSDTASTP